MRQKRRDAQSDRDDRYREVLKESWEQTITQRREVARQKAKDIQQRTGQAHAAAEQWIRGQAADAQEADSIFKARDQNASSRIGFTETIRRDDKTKALLAAEEKLAASRRLAEVEKRRAKVAVQAVRTREEQHARTAEEAKAKRQVSAAPPGVHLIADPAGSSTVDYSKTDFHRQLLGTKTLAAPAPLVYRSIPTLTDEGTVEGNALQRAAAIAEETHRRLEEEKAQQMEFSRRAHDRARETLRQAREAREQLAASAECEEQEKLDRKRRADALAQDCRFCEEQMAEERRTQMLEQRERKEFERMFLRPDLNWHLPEKHPIPPRARGREMDSTIVLAPSARQAEVAARSSGVSLPVKEVWLGADQSGFRPQPLPHVTASDSYEAATRLSCPPQPAPVPSPILAPPPPDVSQPPASVRFQTGQEGHEVDDMVSETEPEPSAATTPPPAPVDAPSRLVDSSPLPIGASVLYTASNPLLGPCEVLGRVLSSTPTAVWVVPDSGGENAVLVPRANVRMAPAAQVGTGYRVAAEKKDDGSPDEVSAEGDSCKADPPAEGHGTSLPTGAVAGGEAEDDMPPVPSQDGGEAGAPRPPDIRLGGDHSGSGGSAEGASQAVEQRAQRQEHDQHEHDKQAHDKQAHDKQEHEYQERQPGAATDAGGTFAGAWHGALPGENAFDATSRRVSALQAGLADLNTRLSSVNIAQSASRYPNPLHSAPPTSSPLLAPPRQAPAPAASAGQPVKKADARRPQRPSAVSGQRKPPAGKPKKKAQTEGWIAGGRASVASAGRVSATPESSTQATTGTPTTGTPPTRSDSGARTSGTTPPSSDPTSGSSPPGEPSVSAIIRRPPRLATPAERARAACAAAAQAVALQAGGDSVSSFITGDFDTLSDADGDFSAAGTRSEDEADLLRREQEGDSFDFDTSSDDHDDDDNASSDEDYLQQVAGPERVRTLRDRVRELEAEVGNAIDRALADDSETGASVATGDELTELSSLSTDFLARNAAAFAARIQ